MDVSEPHMYRKRRNMGKLNFRKIYQSAYDFKKRFHSTLCMNEILVLLPRRESFVQKDPSCIIRKPILAKKLNSTIFLTYNFH